jgi:hypothetical protein
MAITTTYSLKKPTVGGSTDTWGADINDNLDTIDALLDGTTAISPKLSDTTGSEFKVGTTAVTATGAELNYLDITTLGTSEDSKAVTQDASGTIVVGATDGDQTLDIASHDLVDGGLKLGGTLVTASAAELNSVILKAPLASPALTGTPTAPTAAVGTATTQVATTAFVTAAAYPVGSVYIGVTSANPSTLLGTGTWVAFGEGKVLVGYKSGDSNFGTVEGTGGAKTAAHTLLEAEMPSHSHSVLRGDDSNLYKTDYISVMGADAAGSPTSWDNGTGNSGGGGSHSHSTLQPYITVYMWKRTA